MAHCHVCQTENPNNATKCKTCGAPLKIKIDRRASLGFDESASFQDPSALARSVGSGLKDGIALSEEIQGVNIPMKDFEPSDIGSLVEELTPEVGDDISEKLIEGDTKAFRPDEIAIQESPSIEGILDNKALREELDELEDEIKAQNVNKLIDEAFQYMILRRWDKAIPSLEKALELLPDFLMALYLKAVCLANLNRIEEAKRIIQYALPRCPDPFLAILFRDLEASFEVRVIQSYMDGAMEFLRQRKFKKALRPLEKAHKLAPKNLTVLFYLGAVQMQNNQFDKAEKTVATALPYCWNIITRGQFEMLKANIQSQRVSYYLKDPMKLMKEEKWAKATRVLEKAEKKCPGCAEIPVIQAVCLGHKGKLEKAKQQLKRAKSSTRNPSILQTISRLEKDLPILPAEKLLEEAVVLMNKQSWETAIPILNKAHSLAPQGDLILYYLAICYVKVGKVKECQKTCKKALKVTLDVGLKRNIQDLLKNAENIATRGHINAAAKEIKNKKWRAAIRHLDEAISVVPHDSSALYYKAICLAQLGEIDEADYYVGQALQNCKEKEGKKAIQDLKTRLNVIAFEKTLGKAVDNMNASKWQNALNNLEEATSLAPKSQNDIINYYKAICHLRLGDLDKSRTHLKSAEQLTQDKKLRTELTNLHNVLDQAKERKPINEAIKAMNAERWSEAKSKLREVLRKGNTRSRAEVQFYLAVCEARLRNLKEAKRYAEDAKSYATRNSQIYSQAKDFLTQLEKATKYNPINDAVRDMNNKNWESALSTLKNLNYKEPRNAQILFYMAICEFQNEIEYVQYHGELSGTHLYNALKYAMDAKTYCTDYKLEKEIQTLLDNISKSMKPQW